MEIKWKSKYCGVITEEIPKLAPIERAKELTFEEMTDNVMASIFTELCNENAELIDIHYTKALKYLTKRQKKKLRKWVIKAIKRMNKDKRVEK